MNDFIEEITRLFHDTYERLAPEYGYETRKDTKEFDPESPNGKLMTAVCGVVAKAVIEKVGSNIVENEDVFDLRPFEEHSSWHKEYFYVLTRSFDLSDEHAHKLMAMLYADIKRIRRDLISQQRATLANILKGL